MIAVINTSIPCAWAGDISEKPWVLLPIANRPLIDYWLEACTEQHIRSVHIVLHDGAEEVEQYVGSGTRWNVSVEYVFARSTETPVDYLRSISSYWKKGLLYFGGPFFMRRRQAFRPERFRELTACRNDFGNLPYFLYGQNGDDVSRLLDGFEAPGRGLEAIHVHPFVIGTVGDYFDINMKMVSGEFTRYVTAGFATADQSSVGFNVRTPPSSYLRAPIIVGDDCRFGAMTTVGPNALVANHVIVDAFSELSNCLVLEDTYIGRNLEIRNKIVAGNRVIDPADGAFIQIDDSWLVARNRPELMTEDVVRLTVLWCVALVLAALQFIPFLVLYPFIKLSGVAAFRRELFHDPHTGYISLLIFGKIANRKSLLYRIFRALSLDRFPLIILVLRGRMFLCGQPPLRHPKDDAVVKQLKRYYPGVFCYRDYNHDSDLLTDALWYAHIRSLYEDLKILVKAFVSRFLTAGRQIPADSE
ncbi:NDP-sugar synthase [Pontiella agarivorans]|uniref:NDP-sugar synthase n=1 Tax=Pontiella agarivorans TaxID=3038953 RepID=A0ABU5MSG3_9BACT|nr:NDP-sugar synthase [Pontiella agarivorans]MDZ8117141.1 NDP-sugar synthase [Pontiella agarivorans]